MNLIFTIESGVTADNVPVEILGNSANLIDGPYFALSMNMGQSELLNLLSRNDFVGEVMGGQCYARRPEIRLENIQEEVDNEIERDEDDDVIEGPQRDDGNDEIDQEAVDEQPEVQEPCPPGIPAPTSPINDESTLAIVKHLVSPEQGSNIALCQQKLNEFNRMWMNTINAKRKLDLLMKSIDEDETVKKLKDDLEYLSTKCEIVDHIDFFNEYMLAITTKEVVTAIQPRFGSRRLGRMQIIIDLRFLYSPSAPADRAVGMIDIINLDRNPFNCETFWSCGHVHRNRITDRALICLGGYFDHVYEAVISKNLPLVFDVIMRFIMNPDERDAWGCKVSLFPEVINEA